MNGFEEPRWYLYSETDAGQSWLDRETEIVRCRHCKYCDEENYGAWGRGWHCEKFGDVEPDGFCAWGERRSDNARAEQETHDVSDQPLRFMCDACGGVSLEIAPSYCPRCGRKVVER